ncbi:MAG: asparagine synthase (glutamine-hydrolyzing) [Syntrophotaleaceae bacterium]
MCGISGILNFGKSSRDTEELVARMMTLLDHRGPDEAGIYLDADVCLGHVRLSIVGLGCGTQPISNRDDTLWIIYNGEAFNYIELKEDLLKKGYCFKTETDTEVVLALYEEYGPRCLEKINGQFAIAIWDTRSKKLFLARDRVGIRPLFYTNWNGKFSFASEIKALFVDPDIPRAIDLQALSQIFTFWTTITPKTAFENIQELPPGHFMFVSAAGPSRPEAFWRVPFGRPEEHWTGSFGEACEELHSLLKDSVRLRLRADVPVGAYLSGGLDSSITTALVANNFNNHLKTFSLGFQENPFDESSYQKQMVAFLGTEHSEICVTNRHIREDFPQVIWQCEKPLVRTGPVPLYSLSKLVRDSRFKVVLTGEGADEVFGGYNIYKEAKLRQFWARQPDSKWRPLLVQRLYPYIFNDASRAKLFLQQFFSVKPGDLDDPYFSHQVRWRNSGKNTALFSESVRAELSGYNPLGALASRLPDDFDKRDPFSRAQFLEMDIFLSNYLLSSQGDRVGMGNSIELRLPFLDFRVIEFAAKLPPHWKIKGLNEKYILKETFRNIVPEGIRTRAKQPYRAPIKEAFWTDEPGSYVHELLSEESVSKAGYFDAKKVGLLAKRFAKDAKQPANEVQNMALIGILSTQIMHNRFIEEFSPEQIKPRALDKAVRTL